MFRVWVIGFLVVTAATAAAAENGSRGPERWLRERREEAIFADPEPERPRVGTDPLSRFIDHCKREPIGIRPLVTLMPNESDRHGELPTLALFARAQGRTLISLTRMQARPDDGQEVVMQRTLVSDLLAGQRFSLTVYEDHTMGETAARLMGFGTRLTLRPSGWPVRVELLGSYDFDAGASGYLAITGVFNAPPLPVMPAR
jgi:hypothetical protein